MNEFPRVSIIVPTFLEKNKHYLDLAIESIKNLDYPKEQLDVIVVGKKSYMPQYDGVRTVGPDKDDFFAPEGLNYGFRQAARDTEYFFMMNDDVVLTKDSLKRLIRAERKKQPSVVNGISPCDNGRLYDVIIGFQHEGKFMHTGGQFFRYNDLIGYKDSLLNAASIYHEGVFVSNFLCMFATLIPRKVWEMVGEFDENFKTGQDDVDWCIRAHKVGVWLTTSIDSLIWHFGGITSSETIKNSMRAENVAYFVKKWGHLPPYVSPESFEDMKNDRIRFERD